MIIDNPVQFKAWLTIALKPLCGVNSAALATLVFTWIKHDKTLEELRAGTIDLLDVYLQTETRNFVDVLFNHLEKQKYTYQASRGDTDSSTSQIQSESSETRLLQKPPQARKSFLIKRNRITIESPHREPHESVSENLDKDEIKTRNPVKMRLQSPSTSSEHIPRFETNSKNIDALSKNTTCMLDSESDHVVLQDITNDNLLNSDHHAMPTSENVRSDVVEEVHSDNNGDALSQCVQLDNSLQSASSCDEKGAQKVSTADNRDREHNVSINLGCVLYEGVGEVIDHKFTELKSINKISYTQDESVQEQVGIVIDAVEIYALAAKNEKYKKYVHNCWTYTLDRHTLRCSKRQLVQCKAVIVLQNDGSGIQKVKHTGHLPEPYVIEEFAMKMEIARISKTTTLKSEEIIEILKKQYPHAVTHKLEESLKKEIRTIRRHSQPNIPDNLDELSALLDNYIFTRNLTKEIVTVDNESGLILIDKEMITICNEANTLLINGHFQLSKLILNMEHLLVIDVVKSCESYPAIFILTESRCTNLYRVIMQTIKLIMSNLQQVLQKVIIQGENNLVIAFQKEFPGVVMYITHFHYFDAIIKYWFGLELAGAPRDALWKAIALVNIPSDLYNDVLHLINEDLQNLKEAHPSATNFGTFLQQNWYEMRNIMSSKDPPIGTLYQVQLSIIYIEDKFSKFRGNFWAFTELLYREMNEINKKLKMSVSGILSSPQLYAALEKEISRVNKLKGLLARKRISITNLVDRLVDEPRKTVIERSLLRRQPGNSKNSHWNIKIANPKNFKVEPMQMDELHPTGEFHGPKLDSTYQYLEERDSALRSKRRRRYNARDNEGL